MTRAEPRGSAAGPAHPQLPFDEPAEPLLADGVSDVDQGSVSDSDSDGVSDAESDGVSDAESDSVSDAESDGVSDAVSDSVPDGVQTEIAAEQKHLDVLYERLDVMRHDTGIALRQVTAAQTANTPASRSEREAFERLYRDRVRTLLAVEERLCFGRLDLEAGARRYVGRIGISDDDRVELLVDWRAPAAEPFYRATAAHPDGVLRRRQLSTADRRVTAVQDEVLDLAGFERDGVDGSHVVLGDGALFASLDAARSNRMRDIVATIQADQDRVIRAPLPGVLVVQGGPGTGKTAVALHRTAFLLYANRDRIARSGVLVVGPNRMFLRYIDQVLPALGEADAVVMSTPGELYAGVVATRDDRAEVARLKGDARMAGVIAEAVKRRQRLIDRPRPLLVDGTAITLDPAAVRDARERARRSHQPHNEARGVFVQEVIRGLVRSLARARDVDVDDESRPGLLEDLYSSPDVRREVNWCWAPITPERLLRDLYANPDRRREATGRLRRHERDLLARERTAPWTIADVALLDEAAALLGDVGDSGRDRARAEAERRAEVAYAREVQDTFGLSGIVSAEELAARQAGSGPSRSVAERAGGDRGWAYGHVVVDEAQELSAMTWRVLMRRCPSRSMTVVGDVNQTGSAAGSSSWGDALSPHVGDRWRLAELTVNYRTPEQIMALASGVLAAAGSTITPPTSARIGRHEPEFETVDDVNGPHTVELVQRIADVVTPGTVAVITPRAGHDTLAARIAAAMPGQVAADSDALEAPVSVLTVAAAKGLEFDAVVLVEPAAIAEESPRGVNDLYVALTRPTQRLSVVHRRPLPPGM